MGLSNGTGTIVATVTTTQDGTFTVNVSYTNPAALTFFGIVTTSASDYVTSIRYTPPTNGSQNPIIDNVSFAAAPSAAVPEPTSIALLGLGLVGTGSRHSAGSVGPRPESPPGPPPEPGGSPRNDSPTLARSGPTRSRWGEVRFGTPRRSR